MIHIARVVKRLGVTEMLPGVAVVIVAILQYIFLIRLWLGYPIKFVNVLIPLNVVVTGTILSIVGVIAIVLLSIKRWVCGTEAAKRIEKPAEHHSFNGIRSILNRIVAASTLSNYPKLLYTPKNSYALEVRMPVDGPMAVVIGLGQRDECRRDTDAFAAKLGHEVSHLELATTHFEIWVRRLVTLHFRIFGYLLAVFVLLLSFIDLHGLASNSVFGGFVPVFDASIYIKLSAQFAALLMSSFIVFVYPYFFLVRCEHIHDLRGTDLAGTMALAQRVFAKERQTGIGTRIIVSITSFFTLHPSPSGRRSVILLRDFILLSAIFYPLIMASILPLTQLLVAGWRSTFSIPEHLWNLGQTSATSLFLFAVLSADISRLGLSVLLGVRYWWLKIPTYAFVAAVATQLPRVVLEIIYGVRNDFNTLTIIERTWNGLSVGGINVALLVGTLLIGLCLLTAVRIAATGEDCALSWSVIDKIFTLLIMLGAFTISSLTTLAFRQNVLIALFIVASIYGLVFAYLNRCHVCNKRRLSALALRTQCSCGNDNLSYLKHSLL